MKLNMSVKRMNVLEDGYCGVQSISSVSGILGRCKHSLLYTA